MITTLASHAPASAVRRASGLRVNQPVRLSPVAAAGVPARPEPSPQEFRLQAQQIARQACALGRLDALVALARETAQLPGGTGAERGIWAELAELSAIPAAQAQATMGDDSLWLLRRIDGSLVDLLRLRGNGLVGLRPAPEMATWRATVDGLVLANLDGEPSVRLNMRAQQAGRRVLLGQECASGEPRILTEVNCAYSRLRMIDPELTNPMAGLFRSEELIDASLPPVPVVLLAAHRTGSHLLLNLLNTSDRVFLDGELFNAGMISLFGADLPADRKDGLDMLRISDPLRFARVMMSRSHHVDGRRIDHIAARGFKLFPEHARQVYDWALDDPKVRIIHLHRANLLAEFSSYLAALRDQAWVGGAAAGERQRLLFDAERFMRFVEMKQRYLSSLRQRLASRSAPWAEIEYSEISVRSVNRVLTEITGAPSAIPLSTLGIKRQLGEKVLERFLNPEAVLRCLEQLGQPAWAEPERLDMAGFQT